MPILKKEEFDRIAPPEDLKPDDKVFYNQVTNEVFTDYDDYFSRVILCNSLVWTCSLTGKSGLTFQDAQDSEEAAREMVRQFPQSLRKPVLFVTNQTGRGRFQDLVDDVFNFVKDRFFVGEELDYVYNGRRKLGRLKRIHPTDGGSQEQKSASDTPKSKKREMNDVMKIIYDIEDVESGTVYEVPGTDIFRKRTFTRDRLRVFLKLATEQRNNILKVTSPIVEKYGLSEMKFSDLHVGKLPDFPVTPLKRIRKGLKKEPEIKQVKKKTEKPNNNNNSKESNKENKGKPGPKPLDPAKKAARKEEKLMKEKFMAKWSRPREDLTLDGLKPLPAVTSFDCTLPQSALSDAFCVLEFFAAFQQELRVKDYFVSGITFDILQRAVTETDVLGPIIEIFQILLTNLFKLRDVENTFDYDDLNPSDSRPEAIHSAQKEAALSLQNIRQALGFSLTQLTLDSFSLSEVLRLHLESSGAPGIRKNVGNMDPAEDPGLMFKINNPEIVNTLRSGSLFELDASDKLKLLRLIIEQLLCTDGVRDMIEEAGEVYKTSKTELRKIRAMNKTEDNKITPREFDRRQSDLKEKIRNSREKMMLAALGDDRAFRRYYVVYSIPAIIISDEATNIGDNCIIGGTPKERITEYSVAFMKQFLQNVSNDPSNKDMTNVSKVVKSKSESGPYTCTGDRDSCIVHNRALTRDTWKFISSREQLDDLISALDSRGLREQSLKANLQSEIENLYWAIEKCPLHILNRNFENTRKARLPSQFIKESNFFGVNPNFALDLSFRELLLDLEERITNGGLGRLKDIDREQWRNDLSDILDVVSEKKNSEEINSLQGDATLQDILKQLSEALQIVGHSVDKKVLMAPLGEAEPPNKAKKTKERVTDAVALTKNNRESWLNELQMVYNTLNGQQNGGAQNGSSKQNGQDQSIESGSSSESTTNKVQMLNLPRLFLLMYSLERSVMWTRSVSNAACRVCRKKSNPEQMLLCDGCDRGYHMTCMKPPLTKIPQGDWFCAQCTPTQLSPRKRNKAPVEVSSEEEEAADEEEAEENVDEDCDEEDEDLNQEVCHVCQSPGELILCDFCPKSFHMECIDLKRLPRGQWKCPPCVKRKGRKGSPPRAKVKVKSKNKTKFNLGVVADIDSFEYLVCCDIVKLLVKSGYSWPFLERVNRKDAPDYYNVIKKPMDFGTIQGKLNDIKYKDNVTFIADVFQIYANCLVYNNPRSDEVKAAKSLASMFCEMLTQSGLDCFIDLKDSVLEETEQASGWSNGKPKKDDEDDEDEEENEDEEEQREEDDDELEDDEVDEEDDADEESLKKDKKEPINDEDEDEDDDQNSENEDQESVDEDDGDQQDDDEEEEQQQQEDDDDSEEDNEKSSAVDDDDEEEDEDYGKPKSKKAKTSRRKSASPLRKPSSRKRKRVSAFDDDSDDDDDFEQSQPKRRASSRKSS